jgi:hypothetical protein
MQMNKNEGMSWQADQSAVGAMNRPLRALPVRSYFVNLHRCTLVEIGTCPSRQRRRNQAGDHWHLCVSPTPLDRGYASRQARRKEKGRPYGVRRDERKRIY